MPTRPIPLSEASKSGFGEDALQYIPSPPKNSCDTFCPSPLSPAPRILHGAKIRILHGGKIRSVFQILRNTCSSDVTCKSPKTFMTATPLKPTPLSAAAQIAIQLQEIIQNADDAKATQVHFVWDCSRCHGPWLCTVVSMSYSSHLPSSQLRCKGPIFFLINSREIVVDQRLRDDNKNKYALFRVAGRGGREENCPKMLFFLGNAMTMKI